MAKFHRIGPPMARIRRLKSLGADARGSVVTEFALGAPILVLLLTGAIEFGAMTFTTTLMEGALREASRYGITGQEPDPTLRLEKIIDIIHKHTIGLVDLSVAQVDILVYPGFDKIGAGEDFVDGNGNGQYDAGETYTDSNGNGTYDSDIGVAGAGDSGQVVLYRIRYDWPLLTPVFSHLLGNIATVPLSASLAVRNEPFDDSPGGGS